MDSCETFHVVFLGIVTGGTTVVGMIGNSISFVVLSRMQHSSTIILLRSLCISDNLHLCLNLLSRGIPQFSDWFACNALAIVNKWVWPLGTLGLKCTDWFTLLITLYRFIAVTRPLHARVFTTPRRTYTTITFIIIFNSIAVVPRFFEFDIVRENETSCFDYVYTDMYENKIYQVIYKTLFVLMLYGFITPLVCLFFTIRLVIVLHRALKKRQTYLTSNRTFPVSEMTPLEIHITKVSILVAIMYLMGKIPSMIGVISRLIINVDFNARCTGYYYYNNVMEYLLILNGSINFFIYVSSAASFRKHLVDLCQSPFNGCKCHRKVNKGTSHRDSDAFSPTFGSFDTCHTHL